MCLLGEGGKYMGKHHKGKGKGSGFEREICEYLSKWWTDGQRDDVFWRTSISGGRATMRSRRGKQTNNQYGDVTAVDPIGVALTRVFAIELKCGYSKYPLADLMEKSRSDNTVWPDWFRQAELERANAGAVSWLLITRRNYRDVLVSFPGEVFYALNRAGAKLRGAIPQFRSFVFMGKDHSSHPLSLFVTTLEQFCCAVKRKQVEQLWNSLRS